MRALRRFTVRTQLPEPLAPLGELVRNLRWSWHAETTDLFASVDPQLWAACQGDPVRLLGEVGSERLAALAGDRRFLRRLQDAADELGEYLTADRWYQTLRDRPASVAYFSPEFGITEVLPQYSGGLGILAGDHLKAASDLGVPVVGVGLLYGSGYFVQSLSPDGWQQERYPPIEPHGLPITPLTDGAGAPVRITLALPEGRTLAAQVWLAQVGRVPLLLLDSDVEDNAPAERSVTDRLYGGGSDHRLLQELLLGVGGVRALRAYSRVTGAPDPEVFHTNEGHAGFLGLERIRELVADDGLTFDEAHEAVRAGTLFTTHTPVPAGIDRFPRDLVARHFGPGAGWQGVPVERVLELGAEADPNVFNMAHMGLRLAQRANGVSRLHGEVSRGMFAGLWPGFDATEVPIGSVTNGVHAPTWVARPVQEFTERLVGAERVARGEGYEALDRAPDAAVWALRRELRGALVDEVRRRLRDSWLQRGASPAELDWVDGAFDPEVLTIGFARRVPSYKRLTLMLRDPDRLTRLLLHPERPVQLVIAGKAHPADEGGKELIRQIVRFADQAEVRGRIAFLPDYDIGMAKFLYGGCDVWLNNPLRPLEACGTSGMKSALNGGLNLSIRDGWWDELYDGQNGWAIPTADGVDDAHRRDDLESAALYDLLERTVTPRFYERGSGRNAGVPQRWTGMVRHTLATLGPKVLATRMVREYVTGWYVPAAAAARAVAADDGAGARRLAAWTARVRAAWPAVRVVAADVLDIADTPQVGQSVTVRADVYLGGLSADDVEVQAAYGPVDHNDEIRSPRTVPLKPSGPVEAGEQFAGTVPLERPGAFGYTVRVLPHHPLLASPEELGLVANA